MILYTITTTMVPLPLFKLAALFVRHVSKYGAVCLARLFIVIP